MPRGFAKEGAHIGHRASSPSLDQSPVFCQYGSVSREISPGVSLERMMLKLKFQYFGHLMRRDDSLQKTDAGRDWGQEEKGTTEDEMARWHHCLDERESE